MALNQQQVDILTVREDFDAVRRILGEAKDSFSPQYRWENLLTPAPVALNALGACVVATGSSRADTRLTPPREGFKYLEDFGGFSLRASLVKSADLGRLAFMETESNMNKIHLLSENAYRKFNNILEALMDPQAARYMRSELQTWDRASLECYESARTTDSKFGDWLNHASELHRACVTLESTAADQEVLKDIELAVANASLDANKQISTIQMEKSLEAATEAFKKASEEFSSDWDVVSQQIVQKLQDSLTTALNQAMSITNASKPKDADDTTYSQVVRDLVHWEILSTAFVSTTDGIDWEVAGKCVPFAAKMLDNSQKVFASLATGAEPSQQYRSALEIACKVANGLLTELGNAAKGIGYTPPNKDSETVKAWQRDFLSSYATVVALSATAKSLPGSTANGSALLGEGNANLSQLQAKTAQAQAVLESAKNRFSTASEALSATQETYQSSTEIFSEQQQKLNQINSKLESLRSSSLEMVCTHMLTTLHKLTDNFENEIKSILVQSIATMAKMKTEISNLVRFFNAISVIVRFVADKHVNTYIGSINSGGDGPKVGPYSMIDFQRSSILNRMTTIRAYFSAFSEYATMWTQISRDSVFPMLRMVEQLSAFGGQDPRMTGRIASEIQGFSQRALEGISRTAKEKQSKTMRSMESRVSEAKEKKQAFPSVTPEISKAIVSGVGTSKKAVQQGIRAEFDQILLTKVLA
ncbi:hypothetical protein FBEOM_3876 [Fusarium beomiforme]|uniref:Uncharacterized protein n=1 Tax=Fusarium beomiforme TaxID=44412 RepID=A0A9P5AP66_9HYPO|nr:hypothetical protein FBEOM_3876 [Fusarium beomiforme]